MSDIGTHGINNNLNWSPTMLGHRHHHNNFFINDADNETFLKPLNPVYSKKFPITSDMSVPTNTIWKINYYS